jgi:predicted nuclease of predicted toxin-antitoxin system
MTAQTVPPAPPRPRLLTTAEFKALPRTAARQELHEGVLVEMPPPTKRHTRLANRVRDRLAGARPGWEALTGLGCELVPGSPWAQTVARLRGRGFDAVHVREIGLQRAPDHVILERARRETRIVLTFDLDFGDLLALGLASTPSVIIFRLEDETATSVDARLVKVLSEREQDLEVGVLILVEDARYRVRRLPILD